MDLVVSPAIVGFNTQSGGHAPVLTPGQLIDALVLQLIDATTVRLSVAGNIIDVKTKVPLQPGSAVRLAVRGHGSETRLVIVGQGGEPSSTASETPAPSPAASSIAPAGVQPNGAAPEEAAAPVPQKDVLPPPVPSSQVGDASPTAALETATRVAAARQTGLAPLFAEAVVAVQMPDVPTPVRQAAAQLLVMQASFEEGVTPQAIEKAIGNSGLFLEARLAATAVRAAVPAETLPTAAPSMAMLQAAALPAGGDLKAVLFTLREVLKNWLDAPDLSPLPHGVLGEQDAQGTPNLLNTAVQGDAEKRAALARASTADMKVAPPPPPYRNAPTSGQQPVAPLVSGDAPPKLIGLALLDQTDGALARTTLMQAASLPSAPSVMADHTDAATTHWNLEIPFLTPQGTAVAHFEVTRDGHKTATQQQHAQGWRVNFSIDVEPMGPVHAQVSLTGHRAAVRLWAERKAAAAVLRGCIGELNDALRQASLESSEVLVRDGAPPRPLKPGAGRFVDRAS